jgi:tRNA dimethylallyltransferase
MDIGTAKPTTAERAAAPHHCLDLVEPDEAFTASDYRQAALGALQGIAERDGVALLVGGTGLYLRAVARGWPLDRGDSDPSLRSTLEARLAAEGLESVVATLLERDPGAADVVDLRNPRRVVRALERTVLTGTAAPPRPEGYPAPVTWLGLRHEPVVQRRAISARIDAHFENGLLEEAERLRSRYGEDLTAFSAMGYREAFDVLAGRCSIDEAKARDARRTWAYVRRQRTWFRAEPDITWLEAGEGAVTAARTALSAFLVDRERDVYAGRP